MAIPCSGSPGSVMRPTVIAWRYTALSPSPWISTARPTKTCPTASRTCFTPARHSVGPCGDWMFGLEVNALSTGRLMVAVADSCRGFVYCSTGSVYAYQGRRPLTETDPPGVHTTSNYSFTKIAGEAIVQHVAVDHGVPATIIRICSTYGPEGGAPWDRIERMIAGQEIRLHPDAPNNYNPIYEDDYAALGIRALEVASNPALIVNWGGSETVSAEEYLAYAGHCLDSSPTSPTATGRTTRCGPTSPRCTRCWATARSRGNRGFAACSKPGCPTC